MGRDVWCTVESSVRTVRTHLFGLKRNRSGTKMIDCLQRSTCANRGTNSVLEGTFYLSLDGSVYLSDPLYDLKTLFKCFKWLVKATPWSYKWARQTNLIMCHLLDGMKCSHLGQSDTQKSKPPSSVVSGVSGHQLSFLFFSLLWKREPSKGEVIERTGANVCRAFGYLPNCWKL